MQQIEDEMMLKLRARVFVLEVIRYFARARVRRGQIGGGFPRVDLASTPRVALPDREQAITALRHAVMDYYLIHREVAMPNLLVQALSLSYPPPGYITLEMLIEIIQENECSDDEQVSACLGQAELALAKRPVNPLALAMGI